jgi:class 3 adenylate cyclase
LPGADFSPQLGEQEPLFAELESFVADVVAGTHAEIEPDRVLATVLFSDIVGSSEKAAALGDRAWRELLLRHHELVRRQLVRFRGQEVDTAGDGFLASFDGPARAIRCGCAIAETMPELGLEVRVGLHTGECELVDGKVAGIAVHTGARVAANAQPGEVLVSSTVRDLVAGSGLTFEDRGSHELKGIPGEWRLYAAAKSS